MSLAIGGRISIGRYDLDPAGGSPAFNNGIIHAIFHMIGNDSVRIDRSMTAVRYLISGLKFLIMVEAMFSGPVAFDAFIVQIAILTSSSVRIKNLCAIRICLNVL